MRFVTCLKRKSSIFYCKWQLIMHKILLHWKDHSLPPNQPILLSVKFSVLLKQTLKNTRAKKEATSRVPQITVLLRQSQSCIFTQMSYWRKKWGKCYTLFPSLHPLGLQEEQVCDFSTEDPLPTTTSLCSQSSPRHLLAFPCPLERSVWEKNKNPTNKIRNQHRAI